MRRALGLLAAALAAQNVEPRKSPQDYPAQAVLAEAGFGAEYLVRSVSGHGRTFFLPDYLVVEVGVFPARGREVELSLGHFRLHVGGKKKRQTLAAVGPQFVAASLKYPDWERRRNLEVGAGTGDGGVILGRPPVVERFPGDPSGRRRLPQPPRAPESEQGVETAPAARADEVVVAGGLPEGATGRAVAGYLYFPYKGKTKDLRPVELEYQGPAGRAVLVLRHSGR
jgi:hypothetical protein